ncbi:type II toxin-antitoxin system RelE/ParE family toxin [Geobacter sulfurreducens]|uniref:Toxin, RelE family n=1 Tax=Geobacter sulfurreducens (strain ATCC 51573 / DSM 12127 / PCA) TaxID=243231 RepID=Q74AD7_GEOSL|nr:type II toxin-antitoxin system RelE/ParE family toxin [Geobacter sulfurreducens]AAR35812.1 toxin, RelE family [Geobacter sulfurreducens PCA]ADI85200.1 toxin, RelE family [Geobacter sulfurreducens KN400]AJY68670.1 RelE toxin [Geobacter sulfurreducens]QVW34277.1 type II toxin-antitoxin system RelE/ParE family toxin [Geobacter sulfurreducens]UAC03144.1 type II toxin-antitoxin system RelE/ParE family toxin [Geobacter sulfurreducens]
MSYSLEFKESALKEWKKLDGRIREQFKKKLTERLELPRVEPARLSGMPDCYKIKLKNAGYRLVYQVDDNRIIVTVVAVGKRENLTVYRAAEKRVKQ